MCRSPATTPQFKVALGLAPVLQALYPERERRRATLAKESPSPFPADPGKQPPPQSLCSGAQAAPPPSDQTVALPFVLNQTRPRSIGGRVRGGGPCWGPAREGSVTGQFTAQSRVSSPQRTSFHSTSQPPCVCWGGVVLLYPF